MSKKISRKNYLKYAGAGIAVAAVAAAGYVGYFYGRKPRPTPTTTPTPTSTPTPTPTPPTITSLEYKPSRIINDKVYDINAVLEVENPSRVLKEVEVSLIPVDYTHLPKEAFPQEETRIVQLQPRNLEREMFSVDFNDLKGGREYSVKAVANDVTGNAKVKEIETPYVREFENIARLDDITIAAFYYNWYSPNYYIPINLPDRPLLGFYNSDDNVVFNRHVDWATGHGIDVFVFPWFFQGHEQHEILEKNMKAELFDQIKFSFISTYVDKFNPPYNFDDEAVRKEFVNNIGYLVSKYLSLPNAWTINGRPVIVLWASGEYRLTQGNIERAFKEVREISQRILGKELYILGDDIDAKVPVRCSDAVYHYEPLQFGQDRDMVLDEAVPSAIESMQNWIKLSDKIGKPFIPTVSPGFDNTYDYRATSFVPVIHRSLTGFQSYIREAKKLPNPLKTMFVTTFNEWFEGTQIEPTVGYHYGYSDILRKGLQGWSLYS